MAPKHVLFLCVGNSARSQMAEGIARSLAPDDVKVSSAGSHPAGLREEAIRVLEEIGIDISHQRSKGLDSVDMDSVDAVVTLCADQVCPYFPRRVTQVHWALPDPVAEEGDQAMRLESFRRIRDELKRRLEVFFP